jgi:pimeloyl-ACP methyl ester carboxylesterase
MKRRLLIWFLALVLVLIFVVVPYLASRLITNAGTRPMDRQLTTTPASYGADYQDITFTARDGVELRGWYLPSRGKRATVILAHGRFRSRRELLEQAIFLWRAGYGAVLFDFRHHGESGGQYCTLGYNERLDVEGAVKLVREQLSPTHSIILMGVSMGAATSLLAAAETPEVDAVISDSTFLSFEDIVARYIEVFLHLPAFPIANEVVFITERRMNFDKKNFNIEDAVKRANHLPILFIAGGADRRMPSEIAEHLYALVQNPHKALLIIPECGHGKAYRINPTLYEKQVLGFLDSALNSHAAYKPNR